MKVVLTIIACCFFFLTAACSQGPAYKASAGLLFIGGFVVFYDSEGPLSYQTLKPWDVPKNANLMGEVSGNSCQHGLSIPIIFSLANRFSVSGAKGNGSFKKALLDIYEKYPDLEGVYDVKVDVHQWSILGVYKRDCTEVVAQGFRRGGTQLSSRHWPKVLTSKNLSP